MFRDIRPEHWKLHIFYFDPDNPRIWVAKKTGLGFTLNFARPASWAISMGVVAALIYIAVVNN